MIKFLAKNHLLAILEVELTLDGIFNLTSEEVVDDACVAALQRCSFDSRLSIGRNYKEVIHLELACTTRLIQTNVISACLVVVNAGLADMTLSGCCIGKTKACPSFAIGRYFDLDVRLVGAAIAAVDDNVEWSLERNGRFETSRIRLA